LLLKPKNVIVYATLQEFKTELVDKLNKIPTGKCEVGGKPHDVDTIEL
jgi:hypothetical protein